MVYYDAILEEMKKETENIKKEIDSIKNRVASLEAEEKREAKEGTIRPGVRRGRKPKK